MIIPSSSSPPLDLQIPIYIDLNVEISIHIKIGVHVKTLAYLKLTWTSTSLNIEFGKLEATHPLGFKSPMVPLNFVTMSIVSWRTFIKLSS